MHLDLFGVLLLILQNDGRLASLIKYNSYNCAIRIINLLMMDRAVSANIEFIFFFNDQPMQH